jgi:uncharacterized membrane protein YcaP (DUF421 family)
MHQWILDVFNSPSPAGIAIIAGKVTIVYAFLVIGLRILGKRELGQMTIYDLVLLIVLANAVQNAMVGSDNSLVGGLVAGGVLLVWNFLFNQLMLRSKRLRRTMIGEPRLILNHGKLITAHMKAEGITKDQVMAALREHGIASIDQAQIAVLEVDGSISVVPANSSVLKTKRHYRALRI